MEEAWIALGTNQGDRMSQLSNALKLLEKQAGNVVKCSGIYETEPWGVADQPWFLNQVVVIETDKTPEELLNCLLSIEKACGRNSREKWREREIDLDILFYGNMEVKTDELVIPHPEIGNRRFNLVPMLEIDSMRIHPRNGSTIKNMLIECEDNSMVVPYKKEETA